jgi:hypothetical protein
VPSIEKQVKFNHMKTIVQVICFVLLLVNGLGALYGGFLLMVDPSGSKMQMPLSYLEHSPFSNYLIPGIILFIVNGLFSFVTLVCNCVSGYRITLATQMIIPADVVNDF